MLRMPSIFKDNTVEFRFHDPPEGNANWFEKSRGGGGGGGAGIAVFILSKSKRRLVRVILGFEKRDFTVFFCTFQK